MVSRADSLREMIAPVAELYFFLTLGLSSALLDPGISVINLHAAFQHAGIICGVKITARLRFEMMNPLIQHKHYFIVPFENSTFLLELF